MALFPASPSTPSTIAAFNMALPDSELHIISGESNITASGSVNLSSLDSFGNISIHAGSIAGVGEGTHLVSQGSVSLTATDGIGDSQNMLTTDVYRLNANSSAGGIFIDESNYFELFGDIMASGDIQFLYGRNLDAGISATVSLDNANITSTNGFIRFNTADASGAHVREQGSILRHLTHPFLGHRMAVNPTKGGQPFW